MTAIAATASAITTTVVRITVSSVAGEVRIIRASGACDKFLPSGNFCQWRVPSRARGGTPVRGMRFGDDRAAGTPEDLTVPTTDSTSRRWPSRTHAILWSLSTLALFLFGGVLTFATVGDVWRVRQ